MPCGSLAYDGFGMLYHNCTHRHAERERERERDVNVYMYILDMQEESEEREEGGMEGEWRRTENRIG